MPKLKNKLQKKLNETDLHQSLLNLKSALAETTGDVKGKAGEIVSDLLENFQSKTSDYQNEVEEYVADQPLKSLGLAIGLGIVLGKFLL